MNIKKIQYIVQDIKQNSIEIYKILKQNYINIFFCFYIIFMICNIYYESLISKVLLRFNIITSIIYLQICYIVFTIYDQKIDESVIEFTSIAIYINLFKILFLCQFEYLVSSFDDILNTSYVHALINIIILYLWLVLEYIYNYKNFETTKTLNEINKINEKYKDDILFCGKNIFCTLNIYLLLYCLFVRPFVPFLNISLLLIGHIFMSNFFPQSTCFIIKEKWIKIRIMFLFVVILSFLLINLYLDYKYSKLNIYDIIKIFEYCVIFSLHLYKILCEAKIIYKQYNLEIDAKINYV